ncbi:MAG: prolyl oligopeptidase family serine peptidase [Agriterribacter sp.]
MTRQILFFFCLLLFGQTAVAQFNYPATKTVDSADTWHNVTVKDPYRWLEDLNDPEVINWFRAQANFTDSVLNNLPYANTLFNELNKLDVALPELKFDVRRIGNSIFYNQMKTGEGKLKICRQFDNASLPQVIASAEMWGENYSLSSSYEFDPSEKYIAIYAHEGGKEINEVKIYSIAENKMLPDRINGSYKGFMNNQNGVFYYVQLPSYNTHETYTHHNDEIFKTHIIGTDTALDKVIVSKQNSPEFMNYTDGRYFWEVITFKDCGYEFAGVYQTSFAEIWYRKPETAKWKKLFDMSDMVSGIFYFHNKLYYASFRNAPNGIIKMLDLDNPAALHKTILPEQTDPINYIAIAQTKNYLIVPLKKNGVTTYTKFIYLPTNKITASPFKENTSSITYWAVNMNKNDSLLIQREGWTNYPQVTDAVIENAKEKPNKYLATNSLPFADNLIVEEKEVPSYDGTLVPLTIIRRKDLKLNGNNVAIVMGYGAYGDPVLSMYFHRSYAMLANKGVVCCFAHVRGGGEKGNNWHIGGMKQSKPNSWKDFNACAEYLVANGYTSATHLACEGRSAGGILIGRAITERPDLWACAVPEVGVLNVLRSEYSSNGKSQNDEFGAIENINEFFSLMESDALLHIQKGTKYPAMLVTTGWDDPRVSSWLCAKFAAAAQSATTSDKPVLLKVDYNAGHGAGSADKQTIFKNRAKTYAFILWQCGFDKTNKYD